MKCFICDREIRAGHLCDEHVIELYVLLGNEKTTISQPNFKYHCQLCGEYENRIMVEYPNYGWFCDQDIIEEWERLTKGNNLGNKPMLIKQLFEKYDFHDSSIEEMNYEQELQRIEMKIEFCNWRQGFFKEPEDKVITVLLTFENVSSLIIEPDIPITGTEILQVKLLPNEDECLQELEMVLKRESDVIVLRISGNEASVIF